MNDLPHVRDYVFSQPWVVHEPMLEVIAEVIAGHIAGKVNPAADGLKNIAAKQEVTMVSGMAVVPIHGVLMQRASLFDNISGATSYPALKSSCSTWTHPAGKPSVARKPPT
jgi:hypothetical protein